MATCPPKRLAAGRSSECLGLPRPGRGTVAVAILLPAGSETWVWEGPGPHTQKIHKKCWRKFNEVTPLRGVLEQGNCPKSKNLRCPVLLGRDGEGSTGGPSGLR